MRPWYGQSRLRATLLIVCLFWHILPLQGFAADFSKASLTTPIGRRSSLRIGSFNIQVFGESKVNKSFVKDTILSLISRYDIIFIQEIRDDKNKAIYELLKLLNEGSGKSYQALVSTRLGKGEMKEQYAYFYDPAVITAIDSYVYDDVHDDFSREPFVARFKGQGRIFTLAGIHVAPTNVKKELVALGDVKIGIKQRYSDDNTFFMGDFNADCQYYKETEGFDYFDEAPRLLMSNDEDTTVAPSSCTYDRVLGFGDIQKFASDAHAFNFMNLFNIDLNNAKLVSDHFPIEFTIDGTGDMDEITPIPSKLLPLEGSEEPGSVTGTDQAGEPIAPPDSKASSCGLEPYKTPAGFCYGSFDGKKKRVTGVCCL